MKIKSKSNTKIKNQNLVNKNREENRDRFNFTSCPN
jgi:hypothetical protein